MQCVVQQTSRVKDLSSLVRYDDSCLAAVRHVQSILRVVRPRPNERSHSVLLLLRETLRNLSQKKKKRRRVCIYSFVVYSFQINFFHWNYEDFF